MSLTFYTMPNSTATATEAVIAELGVACERVLIDIGGGDTRTPEFLAINPNGRVPTIVHDGVAIWESAAIALYLGDVFGVAAGLYPPTGPARGAAMKWIVWANTVLAEAGGRMASLAPGAEGGAQPGSRDWVEPGDRDPRLLHRAKADVAAALRVLDGALQGGEYLGDDYSLADTHLVVFVGWMTSMGVDLAPYAAVAPWLERCLSRPAIAAVFGE